MCELEAPSSAARAENRCCKVEINWGLHLMGGTRGPHCTPFRTAAGVCHSSGNRAIFMVGGACPLHQPTQLATTSSARASPFIKATTTTHDASARQARPHIDMTDMAG